MNSFSSFATQISTDNSISFPNLTAIPQMTEGVAGHFAGQSLDIVLMIDGSDSFGETISTTEDGFKVNASYTGRRL